MDGITSRISHYYRELGHNCAETIFLAACDAWQLEVPPETAIALAGFAGGMGVRSVCGAVSGGVAALSCRYAKATEHKNPQLMAKVRLLMRTVRERMGDERCSILQPQHYTAEERCLPTIRLVAEILDEIEPVELDRE